MLLLIHILVALSSMGWSTYTFLNVSQKKLRVSYGLVAATLGSGTFLVLTMQVNMLRVCLTGLFYTAAVLVMTVAAHRRLAVERSADKK